MAVEKWIAGAGQGLTYGLCGSTAFASLASNSAVVSDVTVDNSTALDMFCDLSFRCGSITPTGSPFLGVYLYPRLDDGSTFGDGRFAAAAAGPPPSIFSVGTMSFNAAAGALAGAVLGILLPPGVFKFVLWNQLGVALPASGNTLYYRTYNRSIV